MDEAKRGGKVPRRGNLRKLENLVNFGVLSSKIVGLQAIGGRSASFSRFITSFS